MSLGSLQLVVRVGGPVRTDRSTFPRRESPRVITYAHARPAYDATGNTKQPITVSVSIFWDGGTVTPPLPASRASSRWSGNFKLYFKLKPERALDVGRRWTVVIRKSNACLGSERGSYSRPAGPVPTLVTYVRHVISHSSSTAFCRAVTLMNPSPGGWRLPTYSRKYAPSRRV